MEDTNLQNVKETIMASEGYLHIKRCPKNTVQSFIAFANDKDEWNKDWGMAFKHVWDFYQGMNPRTNEALLFKIDELQEQIDELKSQLPAVEAESPKPIQPSHFKTMADGTLRKVK